MRAEHARFAPTSVRLESLDQPLELALGAGGRVIARADPRQLAGRRYMLSLEYHGASPRSELRFPLLSTFDAEGKIERARLPAGTWRWRALEALSTREALSWLSDERAPRELSSGYFELAEGETLVFAVDAPSTPRSEERCRERV